MENEKFDFSQFSSFEKDGKIENIEKLEDYLKESAKKLNVKEQLNVGDEVKLKGVEYTIIITNVKYEMPGIGIVDYAGKRTDKQDDEFLCVFNQKDIESKVEKKIEEEER